MKNVFLFDYRYQPLGSSAWADAMMAIGVSDENIFKNEHPPATHPAYGEGNIIFCHSPGREDSWKQLVISNVIHGVLVLVRAAGGQGPEPDGERVYGCYWKPGDFKPNTTNESVRELIDGLQSGVLLAEFLQPRSVPEAVLAYTVAVHFGFGEQKIAPLRQPADAAYATIHAQALALMRNRNRPLTFDLGLPNVNTFEQQPTAQGEAVSKRFLAMRNLIEVLREDL